MNLSPRNARALRIMAESGVLLTIHDRGWDQPGWEGGQGDGRFLAKQIRLTRANLMVLEREGLIELLPEERPETWMPRRYRISEAGRQRLAILSESAFQPKLPDMTAAELKQKLQDWYQSEGWLFFTEFAINGRRMDAFALGWLGFERWIAQAFEIKVSRGDFLNDIKMPEKRQPAMDSAHQFFYVTTKKIASPSEIPSDCGLIEFRKGRRYVVVDAPIREIERPSWRMMALVVHKALRAYHRRYDYTSGEMRGEDRPYPRLGIETGE